MLFSPHTLTGPVSHQAQEQLLQFLSAARTIRQCASWRTQVQVDHHLGLPLPHLHPVAAQPGGQAADVLLGGKNLLDRHLPHGKGVVAGCGLVRSILVMTRYNAPKRTSKTLRGTGPMATVPNPILPPSIAVSPQGAISIRSRLTGKSALRWTTVRRLGLIVVPITSIIDNGVSAWQRNRKRPGWDELIAACKRGDIKHIVCYHPDRLMRQPRDLEELLSISDRVRNHALRPGERP